MLKRSVFLAAGLLATAVFAQDGKIETKLVNMDTGRILGKEMSTLRLSGRFFGGDEGLGYFGAQMDMGLQPEWGITIRGAFASFERFFGPGFAIRHGGTDLEVLARYAPATTPGLTLSGGVSLPHTPAQDKPFAVGSVIYGLPGDKASFFLGGSGVFRQDSTIIGLSGGFEAWLSEGFSLVGDATAVVSGENTYNVDTGALQRGHVFGIAVRFSPRNTNGQTMSFDLGITNGIGGTTGFALTPALGRSIALYAGAAIRF